MSIFRSSGTAKPDKIWPGTASLKNMAVPVLLKNNLSGALNKSYFLMQFAQDICQIMSKLV